VYKKITMFRRLLTNNIEISGFKRLLISNAVTASTIIMIYSICQRDAKSKDDTRKERNIMNERLDRIYEKKDLVDRDIGHYEFVVSTTKKYSFEESINIFEKNLSRLLKEQDSLRSELESHYRDKYYDNNEY